MVRKLDGYYYDKSKWKLECDNQNNSYLVRLSKSKRRYLITSQVLATAITQVSNNLFIVAEEFQRPTARKKEHWIHLYKIPNNGDIKLISSYQYWNSCEFWADTLVFMDNQEVFDLSKDDTDRHYYEALSSLSDYEMSKILLKRKDNHEYLYCIKEVFSNFGRRDFLQLVVDVETCKPVLPVYSTLRNSLIDLTDNFTLKELLEEEEKYKEIVDSHLATIDLAAGEKILLSAFDED